MRTPANALGKLQMIEELSNGDSSIHRLAPLAKLITTLYFIAIVISFDLYDISGMLQFALYPLTLIILADIPYSAVSGAIITALPFALCTAISSLLLNQTPWTVTDAFTITYGMISAISLIIKCILTVSAVVTLMATTKLLDLCQTLRSLHIPQLFVLQFLLCFRYLGVLLDESQQMSLAYKLRNPKSTGLQLCHAGTLVGQLLLRSYHRADRIYTAMQCRGFPLSLKSTRRPKLNHTDFLYIITTCILLLLGRFLNFSLWIETLF